MHWNYRVLVLDSGAHVVREFVYQDDQIVGYYPKAIGAHGDDREEFLEDLDRLMRASFAPTVDYEETEGITRYVERPSRQGIEWKDVS